MKVAVTTLGSSLEHALDPRFGRAAYILIFDTETHFVEVINQSVNAPAGGAGIAAAQRLVDRDIDALVTGQIGPNALSVLRTAEIPIYQGIDGAARLSVEAFKAGVLVPLERFVPPHSGK